MLVGRVALAVILVHHVPGDLLIHLQQAEAPDAALSRLSLLGCHSHDNCLPWQGVRPLCQAWAPLWGPGKFCASALHEQGGQPCLTSAAQDQADPKHEMHEGHPTPRV